MRRLAIIGLLLLAGCGTVGNREWSYGRLKTACEADGRGVWLDPGVKIDELLLVGQIDPPRPDGPLSPRLAQPTDPSYEVVEWMRRLGVDRVFAWARPPVYGPQGAREVARAGVYQWDRLPIADPRCRADGSRPYQFYRNDAKGQATPIPAEATHCVAPTYKGPLVLSEYPFNFVWWQDESVLGSGVGRLVYEIRRGDGRVVAHIGSYGANPGGLELAPRCFFGSGNLDDLFPATRLAVPPGVHP